MLEKIIIVLVGFVLCTISQTVIWKIVVSGLGWRFEVYNSHYWVIDLKLFSISSLLLAGFLIFDSLLLSCASSFVYFCLALKMGRCINHGLVCTSNKILRVLRISQARIKTSQDTIYLSCDFIGDILLHHLSMEQLTSKFVITLIR